MSKLNDQQYLLLSQFAYVKATVDPQKFADYVKNGYTLKDIIGVEGEKDIDTILGSPDGKIIHRNGRITTAEFVTILTTIANDPVLGNLKLKGYENDDNCGGMVAYALEDDSGNTYFAFTGSEGMLAQGKTGNNLLSEDWINNYRTCLDNMSCQFEPSRRFVEKYKSSAGINYLTGHSQGGANAMYVCAFVEGCTGKIFNGTGISQLLSVEQRQRLTNSGLINYVAHNDFVGAMLFHSEKRVFVEESAEYFSCSSLGINHQTQALVFKDGKAVEAPRTDISKTIEKLSQRYFIYNTLIGSGAKDIFNCFEEIYSSNATIGITDYSQATIDMISGLIKLPIDFLVLIVSYVDSIGEISVESIESEYGLAAELAYTYVLASICPILFVDDFLRALNKNSKVLLDKAKTEFESKGATIVKALHEIEDKLMQFSNPLGNSLGVFEVEVQAAWSELLTCITCVYNDIDNIRKMDEAAIDSFVYEVKSDVSDFF